MSSFKLISVSLFRTFIGIAVHSVTSSGDPISVDLAAALRQDAVGLLGTTVQLSDLVCHLSYHSCDGVLTSLLFERLSRLWLEGSSISVL